MWDRNWRICFTRWQRKIEVNAESWEKRRGFVENEHLACECEAGQT